MSSDGGRREPARSVRAGVVSLCLVQFVDVTGVTVVVTALPDMLADLRATASAGSLVATGYAMFFGGLLMLGARLGDRFGHRRMILLSLAVFAAGAVVAATASSVPVLTAARCLQGAAAAVSVPSALRLVTTITAPGPQRQRAIAVWSAAGAAAGASGFVVGGIITDLVSWRAVFWAYLPLAGVLALVIARSVRPDRDADPSISLSLAGSASLTIAVMAFVVGSSLAPEPRRAWAGAALLGGSVVLAALFVAVDRRAAAPLLPGALLKVPRLRHGTLASALNTAVTSSVITLATLYLQDARGRSPLAAAAMLLPFSVAVVAGSALAAPALRRQRPQRVAAAGLALIAFADLAMIWAAPSPWALPVCVAGAGAGIGLSSVAATGLGTDVDPVWRGTASGIINTAAQPGTAIGIAVLLLIAAVSTGIPAPGVPVPAVALTLVAALGLAGSAAFLTWGNRPAAHHQQSSPGLAAER